MLIKLFLLSDWVLRSNRATSVDGFEAQLDLIVARFETWLAPGFKIRQIFFGAERSGGAVLAKIIGAERSDGAVPSKKFGAERWSGNFKKFRFF